MSKVTSLPFKPRARLLLQLGDQLIRNERVALFELAKNAYDADASFVRIIMNQVESKEKGEIIIEDDGSGMDIDTIVNAWMEPGTDYREKQFEERQRTPKYNRLPMGEKGIGRFAAHKLGHVIQLITRKKDNLEIIVNIDWRSFENSKYLSDVKIDIQKRDPVVFQDGETGTKIRITELRTVWDKRMIRDAYSAITSLVNPFDLGEASFEVKFSCPDQPEVLEGLIKPEELQDYALWYITCILDKKNYKIQYSFKPWTSMEGKIIPRKISIKGEILDPDSAKSKKLDLSRYNIGPVAVRLYVYDRDSRILNLLMGNKKQLKSYLDRNGGIRVYRDGIRVYDYGEKGNDWLDLDLRRVNIPAERISNNLVLGAVFLDREASESLIEKTNREGFVENQAYYLLKKAVSFVIDEVQHERNIDKSKLRDFFGPTKRKEPVHTAFNKLRKEIEKKIEDTKLRKGLVRHINRAENEYKEVRDHLLTSSGAGLSLSIVIHEFDKIIKELVLVVEREKSSKRIIKLVQHLDRLTKGFTALVRRGKMKNNDLKEIINQAVFNVEYRLDAHGIEIIDGFSNTKCNANVRCTRNYILMVLMNILDNSIWWLAHKYGRKKGVKKIYITITCTIDGSVILIIADNGTGFTMPIEYVIKPFFTKKPGGMGLGLYIADQIMNAHKGKLIFPDRSDYDIPEDIDGAVVGLLFERNA